MSINDPVRERVGHDSIYSIGILGTWPRVAKMTAKHIKVFPQPIVSARIPTMMDQWLNLVRK